MSVRWVAVDDNDSAINYSSGWTQQNGANWNNQGNFGQPFMNTLHAVTGGSASFSYTFNGSNGKVIGTTNVRTSGSVQDPVWSCEVDGTTIPLSKPFAYVENNWVLCSWSNIAAGQHTLKVTATSSTQAFLFDQFQYVPSTNADITGVNIVIANTDTAINYDSGWKTLGGALSMMAPAAGAVMSFSFYGTGITWFGYIPVELPHGATTAAYSIDGGSSTTFTVPGSFGGISQYSQLIFQTGTLPFGSHTLRVTSQGQNSLTPLVLTWLVVQNGVTEVPSSSSGNSGSGSTTNAPNFITVVTTLPGGGQSTTTISGSQSATTSSNTGSGDGTNSGSSSSNLPSSLAGTTSGNSTVTSASKSSPPIGAIVGGILGGLFLVLAILLFLYYRRKKKERYANEAEQVQPFYHDIPSGGATPSGFSGPPSEASGVHGPYQTTEVGNSRGFFARKAAMASTSPLSPYPNTIPSFYPNPINSQADAYAESSARDSIHAGASGPSSEVSAPSSAGSAVPLLQPNRKREEHLAESSPPGTSRTVVTHEDSGFRMPRAGGSGTPLSSTIVEYPPAYTPG